MEKQKINSNFKLGKLFVVLTIVLVISPIFFVCIVSAATYKSANFIVETPDPNFARQVAQVAEKYRHDLAIAWFGKEMPNWVQPCPITVQVGGGAGGATTFVFDRGEVFGWRMSIQGSPERILDSVLPHEITHMIFASMFRQPLPRWADEGGATSVEHSSERNKHRQMLDQFLRTGRGISFNNMFAMTEYPADIMPLYAQGYSVAEFLIQIGGRQRYTQFLADALKSGDWAGAIQRNYGSILGYVGTVYGGKGNLDLGALQNIWLNWVRHGSPLNTKYDNNVQQASNPPVVNPPITPQPITRQPVKPQNPKGPNPLVPVPQPRGPLIGRAPLMH